MRNVMIAFMAIVSLIVLETVFLPLSDVWLGAELPVWPFAAALVLVTLPVVALYSAIAGRARQ